MKPFHKLAELFPRMDAEEFEKLKKDISENGLLEPITLHPDGSIIDGRNRYLACLDVGVTPRYDIWSGTGSLLTFVLSKNLHRRHLDTSQRAALAVNVQSMLGEDARERQRAAGAQGAKFGAEGGRGNKKKPLLVILPEGVFSEPASEQEPKQEPEPKKTKKQPEPTSRDVAASMVGVSPTYVQEAKKIEQESSELFERVKSGQVTIQEAKREIKEKKKEEKKEQIAEQARQIEIVPAVVRANIQMQPGQWCKLGRHLLYCGDTSQPQFIERLPQRVSFAFADPPYGAGVETFDDRVFYWQHDYLIERADVVAVTPGIMSIFTFAQRTTMPYKWSMATWIKNGMTRGALGYGNWIYTALFARDVSLFRQAQDVYQITIETSATDETKHKGRKPSQYMLHLIDLFAPVGSTVIDPFLGSGQTLLSCERSDRACIGGELIPEHCNEIIARWQELTKQYAEVVSS
jgi:ParB family chromosome partitioning protein